MSLRVTILGSGTSSGVPLIGCDCAVCRSDDPRNHRLRPGAMLETSDQTVPIDTPTDLRHQVLANDIRRVDAVLYTHAHADHVLGLDDLRAFNRIQCAAIPCFGSASTLAEIESMFDYVFEPGEVKAGRPRLELLVLDALRYRRHATHFSVGEAIGAAARIGARRTLLTHMTHAIDYARPEVPMPASVEFAYDGLVVELP